MDLKIEIFKELDKYAPEHAILATNTSTIIDEAMEFGLNHPMGPLELADLVGLDTRLRNMEYLYQTLG